MDKYPGDKLRIIRLTQVVIGIENYNALPTGARLNAPTSHPYESKFHTGTEKSELQK